MIEAVQNTKVISEDGDADESNPYSVEEKVAAIRKDIADENSKNSADEIEELPRPHLEASIHEHCTKGDRDEASDRTVNKYINHVTDDLGLTEDPKNDILFIKNTDMNGPAFEQKDFADLTTDERIEAVRIKLLCKAKPGTGAQVSAADIKSEFFDGEPSESVAHDLRNRAQEADGFGSRTGGDKKKKVYVDINDVTDKGLLEAAGMTTPNEKEEIEDKAKDEMDALINAQLVADGGSD